MSRGMVDESPTQRSVLGSDGGTSPAGLEPRLRDLEARQAEITRRILEPRRNVHALTVAIVGASIAFFSSVVTKYLEGRSSQRIEQGRAEASLILEAVRTGDQDKAIDNLRFFLALGLLTDKDGRMTKQFEERGVPVLPEPATGATQTQLLVPAIGPLPPLSARKSVGGKYTGLVVDARGLGARPAMAPRLLDQKGGVIYGPAWVQREYATSYGMVGYSRSLEDAVSNPRVADHPVVVRAIGATSSTHADLVLTDKDAELLRKADHDGDFLPNARLMIVLD
jgi:hypothetical protein